LANPGDAPARGRVPEQPARDEAARRAAFPAGAAVTVAELTADPHPALRRLREHEPVSWVPALGGWLVTRRDLALTVLRDAGRFTVDDPRFTTARVVGPSMLSLDGPVHKRHRDPFFAGLREDTAGRLPAFVAEAAAGLVAQLAPAGHAELRRGLAGPLAVAVVAEILGLGETEPDTILAWYDAIVRAVSELAGTDGSHTNAVIHPAQPEPTRPGSMRPETPGSGTTTPGTAGLEDTGPETVGSGTAGSGASGSGTTGPRITGPETAGSGTAWSGASGSGTSGPGAEGPGTSWPGTTRSGSAGLGGTGPDGAAEGGAALDEGVQRRGVVAFGELAERLQLVLARHGDQTLLGTAAAAGLSPGEVVSNAAVLMFGGIETTEGMICNAAWYLLREPGPGAAAAAADPEVLAAVVEESLRLEPAAAVVDRYATEDTELGGARIGRGDLVTVSLAGANRDPDFYPEPDRFDPGRDNLRQHLAFARGPHFCIGAQLAALEAREAVGALVAQLPGLRLDPDRPTAPQGLVFRKPAALHVLWDSP
jgi:cytochrome P450